MARRIITVAGAKRRFHRQVETAIRIYAEERESCLPTWESITGDARSPLIAAKIVGLAFLSLVAAWEEFLEETFLRYLAGAQAASGFRPTARIGCADSLPHARRLLAGGGGDGHSSRFFRWGDYAWVESTAQLFFEHGAPWTSVNEIFKQRLSNAQAIRNRVAHHSAKARKQFKLTANVLTGNPADMPLPRGYSPGLLLIESPERAFGKPWCDLQAFQWNDIFSAYFCMMMELADVIVPDSPIIEPLQSTTS